MPRSIPRRALLRSCFLPALAAALALLVVIPSLWGPAEALYPVQVDSAEYDRVGRGLARLFEELPTAVPRLIRGEFSEVDRARYGLDGWIFQHASSYLVMLGAAYFVSGESETAGRLLTAFFFAGAAALSMVWTRRHFGSRTAVLLLPLFLLWPAHVHFGSAVMTELPMIFFAMAAVVFLGAARASPFRTGLGGAMLGMLFLAKTTFQALVIPALLLDLWAQGSRPVRRWFRHLAWRVVGFLLVVGAWAVFLHAAGLTVNPLSERGDREMWVFRGTYLSDRGFESVGVGDVIHPELLEAIERNELTPEAERSRRIYKDAFLLNVRQDPIGWGALVLAKARWFWRLPALKEDVQTWFGLLPSPVRLQPVLVGLALLGLAGAVRMGPAVWIPALIAAYVCAIHAFSHLVSRYNIPAMALAMPYAAFGVIQITQVVRHWRRWMERPGRILIASVLIALAFDLGTWLIGRDVFVEWGFSTSGGHRLASLLGFGALGVWFWPGWMILRRAGWSKPAAATALALVLLVPAATRLAEAVVDPDPDEWLARLERPGDRIIQDIALPVPIDWDDIEVAEIQIDMLASLSRQAELSVRVNGEELARFRSSAHVPPATFELDRQIFAAEDRYARVRDALTRHHEQFVRRRYPDTGLEYYPQWFRFPIPLERIRDTGSIHVEITFEQGDGWVDIYGDHESNADGAGRWVRAPAFLTNPYELSTHQFRTFASERRRADVRMIRPLRLSSSGARAAFHRGGRSLGSDASPAPGKQSGEFRIRLRAKVRGGYVYRERIESAIDDRIIWASTRLPDDEPVPTEMLHHLAARRDTYFDGWITY